MGMHPVQILSIAGMLAMSLAPLASAYDQSFAIPDLPDDYRYEFTNQVTFTLRIEPGSAGSAELFGDSTELDEKLSYCSVKIGGAQYVLRENVMKPAVPLRVSGQALALRRQTEAGALLLVDRSDFEADRVMPLLQHVAQYPDYDGLYVQLACEKSDFTAKRFMISVQFEPPLDDYCFDPNDPACRPDVEWP